MPISSNSLVRIISVSPEYLRWFLPSDHATAHSESQGVSLLLFPYSRFDNFSHTVHAISLFHMSYTQDTTFSSVTLTEDDLIALDATLDPFPLFS